MSNAPKARPPYRSPWMTEEMDDVRTLCKTFCEKELKPNAERFAEQHMVDRDTWKKAGDAGVLLISVPEEYGGGGLDFASEAIFLEEQSYAFDDALGYGIHSTIVAHYLLTYGNEEQKKKWLPLLASGERVGAIAMTEPGAGSDLQAIRTTARRDGDHYVINGSKTFITNGTHGDIIVLVVRTGEAGAKGISLVVVETEGLAGFERGKVLNKIGMHGQDTRELFFTDMRVPVENLLGPQEGLGFYQLMAQLPQERLAVAIGSVAVCEAMVKETIAYTKDRKVFGRSVFDFQNTKYVLSECLSDTLAARTLTDHFVGLHNEGKCDAAGASIAKYWVSDMQAKVLDRLLQLYGGYGYMMEYPIARAYTAARVQRIYAGTNEIMKELISRTL